MHTFLLEYIQGGPHQFFLRRPRNRRDGLIMKAWSSSGNGRERVGPWGRWRVRGYGSWLPTTVGEETQRRSGCTGAMAGEVWELGREKKERIGSWEVAAVQGCWSWLATAVASWGRNSERSRRVVRRGHGGWGLRVGKERRRGWGHGVGGGDECGATGRGYQWWLPVGEETQRGVGARCAVADRVWELGKKEEREGEAVGGGGEYGAAGHVANDGWGSDSERSRCAVTVVSGVWKLGKRGEGEGGAMGAVASEGHRGWRRV